MEQTLNSKLITRGQPNTKFEVEGREEGEGYYSTVNRTSEYGLVLIQQWWGLNQSLIITADRFAAQGYKVLVPDIYRGKVAESREQAGHLLSGLDWVGAIKDIAASKKFLEKHGCTKIGMVGFCMGGALTIAAAASIPGFDAVAPFYGIPDLNKFDLKNITCKFQGHFGELDPMKGFSDAESGRNLEKQLQVHNPSAKVIIWPGANHAFMNQDSPNYHQTTYHAALAKTKQIFN